jgi:hypothetical protein
LSLMTIIATTSRIASFRRANDYLDKLLPELKVEIVLRLENPLHLAVCSRQWYNLVNSPFMKAKWLIKKYGTHALFYALQYGKSFVNVDVVECLFAQKVHLSRYFIQTLAHEFPSHVSLIGYIPLRDINILNPYRNNSIQNKTQTLWWPSDLPQDVTSRILKEGNNRFGDNIVLGNDMKLFSSLSENLLKFSKLGKELENPLEEIIALIRTYKLAPFPKIPNRMTEDDLSFFGVNIKALTIGKDCHSIIILLQQYWFILN